MQRLVELEKGKIVNNANGQEKNRMPGTQNGKVRRNERERRRVCRVRAK